MTPYKSGLFPKSQKVKVPYNVRKFKALESQLVLCSRVHAVTPIELCTNKIRLTQLLSCTLVDLVVALWVRSIILTNNINSFGKLEKEKLLKIVIIFLKDKNHLYG